MTRSLLYIWPHFLAAHSRGRVQLLSFVEAIIFTGLYAASRPGRRRVLDVLRLASATDPDSAMTRSELASHLSRPLDQLVREGFVVATPDGHVYLDQRRADSYSDAPRMIALGTIGIAAFIVGAWLIL